jgi:hypothetical protein
MFDYADEPIEDGKFNLEFDAIHGRFIGGLYLVVARELDGEECNVKNQDHDIDKDEMS